MNFKWNCYAILCGKHDWKSKDVTCHGAEWNLHDKRPIKDKDPYLEGERKQEATEKRLLRTVCGRTDARGYSVPNHAWGKCQVFNNSKLQSNSKLSRELESEILSIGKQQGSIRTGRLLMVDATCMSQ